MALRLLMPQGLPYGLAAVDPTIEFQAGMIAGFTQLGADIIATLSDGRTIQPFGIIDDNKDSAFSTAVVDEQVLIPVVGVPDGYGNYVSTIDVMGFLQHPGIIAGTFTSDVTVYLNPINGTITVPAGTILNHDNDSNNEPDSFLVTCSYTYEITGTLGEDTTSGSGQMTIWFTRGLYATDQFETNVDYQLNDTLYCSENGKITSVANGPAIGICTGPPSALQQDIEFLFL